MLIFVAGENHRYQKFKGKGLGDGSAIGRIYFASENRGPIFGSQHPSWAAHNHL